MGFLVMIIKNVKKYFTFEVTVLDDKSVRRRFRASNYQSTTRVKPFICTMPMRLDEGWNQIQFNLSDFTRRAYGTNYIETLRVRLHAIVASGASISQIGCTARKSCLLSSSCFSLSRKGQSKLLVVLQLSNLLARRIYALRSVLASFNRRRPRCVGIHLVSLRRCDV